MHGTSSTGHEGWTWDEPRTLPSTTKRARALRRPFSSLGAVKLGQNLDREASASLNTPELGSDKGSAGVPCGGRRDVVSRCSVNASVTRAEPGARAGAARRGAR
jgi:hypothetical protein